MKLVLFDIDGTLTDTNDVDTLCFVHALADVFGISDVDTDWSIYEDATDSALTANLINNHLGRSPNNEEIVRMQNRFHSLLKAAFAYSGEACQAVCGGPQFLNRLSNDSDFAVAFATGGWSLTARLKLKTAGYDYANIPMASADDAQRRVEICSIATDRSITQNKLSAFDSVVYIGDGVWDARAAVELGYRFVGVAHRRDAELLKKQGAASVIPDFDSSNHAELLAEIRNY